MPPTPKDKIFRGAAIPNLTPLIKKDQTNDLETRQQKEENPIYAAKKLQPIEIPGSMSPTINNKTNIKTKNTTAAMVPAIKGSRILFL